MTNKVEGFGFIVEIMSLVMKISTVVTGAGIIMVVVGFIAFSVMQGQPNSEAGVQMVKHGGAFVGLLGIGASIAGTLLYIIDRYQVAV